MPLAWIAVLTLIAGLLGAPGARAGWRPPVDGAVVRGFDFGGNPYEGGRHRGADFTARPGAPIQAPCGGRVVVAGRVGSSGRVVTILCGRWRVTQMPLRAIDVRRGDAVHRGARIGTAERSREHHGLHLGVRRDGVRFGYVDPLRFFTGEPPPPPLVGGRRPAYRPPRLGPAPRPARPRAAASPVVRPVPATAPFVVRPVTGAAPAAPRAAGPTPVGSTPVGSNPVGSNPGTAPWPAWAGLALILAGLGAGGSAVAGRRRSRASSPVASEARFEA